MKIAAVIASLIIGSSSLALAQPGNVYGAPANVYGAQQATEPCITPAPAPAPAPVVQPVVYLPQHHSWTALSQPMRLVNGQRIKVGAKEGQFNRVELKATRGTSFVSTVAIEFSGGGMQTVQLNQNLSSSLQINLDGTNRSIKNITVYGASKGRSAYQVLAV